MTVYPYIIGIAGEKESGKGVAAQIIDAVIPGGAFKVAFADEMKRDIYQMLRHPIDMMPHPLWVMLADRGYKHADHEKLRDMVRGLSDRDFSMVEKVNHLKKSPLKDKVRVLMQTYGTEYVRRIASNDLHWVNIVDHAIRHHADSRVVVIPDVRMQIEADYIKERGGYLIKVERLWGTKREPDNHATEAEVSTLQGIDSVVENTTLPEFTHRLINLLLTMRGREIFGF